MSLINIEIFRREAATYAGRVYNLSRAASLILSRSGAGNQQEVDDIVYDLIEVIGEYGAKLELATSRIETELIRPQAN